MSEKRMARLGKRQPCIMYGAMTRTVSKPRTLKVQPNKNFSPDSQFTPKGHPKLAKGKVGVLLINLGTPDATDPSSVRRYLAEFLWDPRVIEWPRALWWPVLHGVVLRRRPRRSGEAYDKIWNRELDESPLRTFTRAQAGKLERAMANHGPALVVDWAMRYGDPSIPSRLEAMMAAGCERVLVFPLYPQYSATTSASVSDQVFDTLKSWRWQPALRVVPPYYDEKIYISALASSVKASLGALDWKPQVVLTSYHGIPQSYFEKGDPYHCHCQKTTRLLRQELGWSEKKLRLTFQSRFGPEEWLQPYTEDTVRELAQSSIKRIAIMSPGFASDCLETLEEIAMGVGEAFLESGGERFHFIPCLNDSTAGMRVIRSLVERELSGWI
jgi:ferrochelatase